eukprot:jgi/Orpsp1_1/1180401/evm.model.c7180000073270.1
MTGRRGRPQLNTEESNNARRMVNFNYSENFNRITELTTENYRRWKRNIIHLLSINDLLAYVTTEKVKKLRKRDIEKNIENYTEDQLDDSLVYALGTEEVDINNDITTQWIIMNSLSENTQKIIDGQANTAFKIWNSLKESFTKNKQIRKLELKKKLDELKRDGDMSSSIKVGTLNRALPENLRYINVFQYTNDWKECSNYVKKVIPEIITSNNIETNNIKNNNTKNIFYTESEEINKTKNNKVKKPTIKRLKTRRNGRCNYCHKKGHYFYECEKRKQDRQNKLRRKKVFKIKNYKKHYKRKHYANFVQVDNYDPTYSESFTKDYNDTETVDINCLHKQNQHFTKNNKELVCWILDSGASINITNRIDKLTNIKKCNEKLYFANNQTVTTNYIGTFKGYINNQEIIINDVYYSPIINKNLLSLGKLAQQNYKVIFNMYHNKPCATIYDEHQNKIINILSTTNNTFKFWISTQPLYLNDIKKISINNEINYTNMKANDRLNLWHRRFAHFDIKMIKH